MSEDIRHEGTVTAIEGGHVRVRIAQMAACAACKVAGQCHASDMKEKEVDVYDCHLPGLQVGDSVTVFASGATARRSLMLGFGYPLLLMMATLLLMVLTRQDEALTALAMLGVLVPYYILLWCLRRRIEHRLTFWIERHNAAN